MCIDCFTCIRIKSMCMRSWYRYVLQKQEWFPLRTQCAFFKTYHLKWKQKYHHSDKMAILWQRCRGFSDSVTSLFESKLGRKLESYQKTKALLKGFWKLIVLSFRCCLCLLRTNTNNLNQSTLILVNQSREIFREISCLTWWKSVKHNFLIFTFCSHMA